MDHGAKTLKRTPLAAMHEKLGARMTEFADWHLPLCYGSVLDEHLAVRRAAGLFDVSHMGEIEVRGAHAFPFLQGLLTADLRSLPPARCRYTLLCYEHGGAVDDCFLYCFNSSRYWLVVNAANIAKDLSWLRDHASRYSVTIRDLSSEKAKLDLQGPRAVEIAARASPFPLALLRRFDFVETRLNSVPAVVSRSGYTGEDGLEIYFDAAYAELVWNDLLSRGGPELKPAGLGARDSLRVEAGYSLYGHELSEHISPVEAGIGWVVPSGKKDEYIGKNLLLRQKESGTAKNLYAFTMEKNTLPRPGAEIYVGNDRVGWVSSGAFSPVLDRAIGLGFIENRRLETGHEIEIDMRSARHAARIAKRPFYEYQGGKR